MDGFAPRDRAAVEYWYWKFHVEDLAFLVDVIVRRRTGLAEVRVSLWRAGIGRVIHAETADWSATPSRVVVGPSEIAPGRSAGAAGDVSWDLRWSDGGVAVTPLPGPLLRLEPFDTAILAWPLARFDGSVTVAGRRYEVRDVPGSFSHYWGRSLAASWIWLSASSFENEPDRRLEAIVGIRTRLLGGPTYPVTLGFLSVADGRGVDTTISTINGLVSARPIPGGVAIETRRLGGPSHRVEATWGDVPPNDIGDEVIQTMHADLVLDGHRAAPGTVGMEMRRRPPGF